MFVKWSKHMIEQNVLDQVVFIQMAHFLLLTI